MMQMRTHTCGELRLANAGQRVKIVGWMENVRVVGQNFAFVVLRDFYGTTQVVVENQEMMDIINGLNKESTISVEGTVRERASKNPKQATGDVEVVPEKIEVLGRCRYNSLPFEINRSREADETQRLKYRYLDLRRPSQLKNLVLRHKVVQVMRNFLDKEGFLEIETPVLGKSTPEGARDYLVPSRVHPGNFYGLPQSPQLYKQLLMVSGMDRYYQVAKCFRDEDLRADRQPEFTQVDMELSFVEIEDIMDINERMMQKVFKDLMNVDIKLPLPRMTYAEAMERFGSDKPDVRFGMELKNISDVVAGTDFVVFKSALENGGSVRAINAKGCGSFPRKKIDSLVEFVKTYKAKGLAWIVVNADGTIKSQIAKFFTPEKMQEIVDAMDGQPGDLILIQTDTKPIYRHSFTANYYIFNVKNNKMEPLSTGGPQQVPLFSPDGNQIAFVRNNNIYLVKLLFNNSESQITTDGKYNEVLNGIPDWVYEEEFGFNRAFDFSADSKMIAYIRFDESKVPIHDQPYQNIRRSLYHSPLSHERSTK